MGGILTRYYLQHYSLPNVGRAVMLSPPNQGSEVAEYLKSKPLFSKALGPAGQELGLGHNSITTQLGGADFDLGIICGTRTSDPWFSFLFDGLNDGKVSVEKARMDGMNDFITVPHGHTFIMQQPDVINHISSYLATGSFAR